MRRTSIACLSLVLLFSFAAASGAAASSGAGTRWYVDCSASQAGNGSRAHPFTNLRAASTVQLGPGNRLLFRRGTTCRGMLTARGSGSAGARAIIGAYGSASAARPAINGATAKAAVWLTDMSYVTIEDLELANVGDSTQLHAGLYFTSAAAPSKGITAQNLVVEHVDSLNSFDGGKRGGGIVGETLSASGRFSDVRIRRNVVRDVSRQGITVYGTSNPSTRPVAQDPWPQGTSGLVISDNHVSNVDGDGIVALGTDGAVIEHNVVRRINLAGFDFLSADRNCAAGIWAYDANNTVIQYNEVSDSHYGPSTKPGALNGCDGTAFDIDGHQDGTIIQYNYSHDNDGGFVLLCLSGGTADDPNPPHHGDVRFNLSIDDNASFNPTTCAGDFNPAVNNLDGIRIFGNTFVAATPRVTFELYPPLDVAYYGDSLFQNNIVFATSRRTTVGDFVCGSSCSNNLFFRVPVPANATNSVTSNPKFLVPTRRGTGFGVADSFEVKPASPAIHGGAPVPAGVVPRATRDFFGNLVTNRPPIGFAVA